MSDLIKSFVFFILFIFSACTNDVVQSGKSKEERRSSFNYDTLGLKFYKHVCACEKGTELVVKTKFIKVPDTISHLGLVGLNQELIFKRGDQIINTLYPPFRIRNKNLNLKDSLETLETLVIKVKCIQKNKKFVYALYGIHSFDPPHEFFALCSIDGEWLWYFYGSMHEVFAHFGNEEPYIAQFGEEINSLKNMATVLPL